MKGDTMKARKRTKSINVRIPEPLFERINTLVEEKLEAGDEEANFSTIVRKLIRLGLIELETR